MWILRKQVSFYKHAYISSVWCIRSLHVKHLGYILLQLLHPLYLEEQFHYTIAKKLGHLRSD